MEVCAILITSEILLSSNMAQEPNFCDVQEETYLKPFFSAWVSFCYSPNIKLISTQIYKDAIKFVTW